MLSNLVYNLFMIKQTIKFTASPEVIYDILMDEKKHADFTKANAHIDPTVGGKFSVWDDYATGENLELMPGQKIVQLWRASDWPDDAVSKVTFALKSTETGTELQFTHENIPKGFEDDIAQGWKDFYWEPLGEYLQNL